MLRKRLTYMAQACGEVPLTLADQIILKALIIKDHLYLQLLSRWYLFHVCFANIS